MYTLGMRPILAIKCICWFTTTLRLFTGSLRLLTGSLGLLAGTMGLLTGTLDSLAGAASRPNILIAISDDQSYPHTSAYGYKSVSTPAFDRVAREGILFHNAFTPAPGCSPMRAAFLTGRNLWQLEHAGTHASSFPKRYEVFPDRLQQAGYVIGFTGKGWGPGNWEVSGRKQNPAGRQFSQHKIKPPGGISSDDYAANFAQFFTEYRGITAAGNTADRPFCFWYGGHEPHRSYQPGIGRAHGLDITKVQVPPFLPDTPEVRDDLLDYCYEIEWFDRHLGRMLDLLDAAGELDNTLVIVTSDNGMPFPRAKANVYEYGIHMPLAVSWPANIPAGRSIDDLINLIDLTATIYEVSGVAPPQQNKIAGHSMVQLLTSKQEGMIEPQRDAIFTGRERHSSSRYHSLGYPQRAIRTHRHLLIRNFRPERWPAGAPQKFGTGKSPSDSDFASETLGPMHAGYHDIDACPSLDFLVQHASDPEFSRYLQLSVNKRPAVELFDIITDPGCLTNLAEEPKFAVTRQQLTDRLNDYLQQTDDARVKSKTDAENRNREHNRLGDIWETYPRYSHLRWFPTPIWARQHPHWVPTQDWLEQRRPSVPQQKIQ
jgi:N-sulfoglucosamine sulfohydrolase